jgi:glucose-1-phosphate adenylyltransferase
LLNIVNHQKLETRGEDEPCIIREGIPVVVEEGVLADGYRL